MEDNDMFENKDQWIQDTVPESEIRKIQKSIQKRNWRTIAISVLLATAVLVGCVYGVIPAVERLYWNPGDSSFDSHTSDLTLVLQAYTELFQPGWEIGSVTYGRTGFASYDLSITRYDIARAEYTFMTATLRKDELGWDYRFTSEGPTINLFDRACYPFYPMWEEEKDYTQEKLSELPEYVTVEAAVSFSTDLSMDEIIALKDEYELPITWVAIRNAPMEEQRLPLCGMDPFSGGIAYPDVNEQYPCFNPELTYSGEYLDQHFKSLLQFSSDQLVAGRGAQVYGGDRNYYAEVLDYVEENGVYSYGCVVFTTPQRLLELMENEQVSQINLMDAWLDV